jgi:hypothetical protein
MGGHNMFDFLFSSKNAKLVKKWHKEHEQIVELAHKVIGEYSKNNHDKAKEYLRQLNELAVDHVMNEDIQLFKLTHEEKGIDEETERLVHEFVDSFKKTKLALMDFLSKYSRPEVPLDENFFKQFNELVEVLGERIAFEERHVYSKLKEK